jgi:ubiquinone/menaquinone biosynthesis C-methylase UbiE
VSEQVLAPRAGYDRVASEYHAWRWYGFWRRNEEPIVAAWLGSLSRGIVLDAGCGTGPYTRRILERGHRCIALDISLQMLEVNRRTARAAPGGSRLHCVEGDTVALPFRSDAFDSVLCTRVLSHVECVQSAVREFGRVLRPDGQCLIADVHPEHPYRHVTIPARGTPVAIETHKHSVERLKVLADAADLRVEAVEEYALGDLAEKPDPTDFSKLYEHPDRPIFYVCRLVKSGRMPLR